MPYSGPGDKNLPDNVKKMSEHDRKQWVEVFNSAMEQHHDEGKAFAMANGVVKKKKDLISSFYSIDTRQLDQSMVKYDAMGGGQGKGCGNCHWFVPQDTGCICVEGDIMPTGICNLWMAQPEQVISPIPVTIVKQNAIKQFAISLKDAALALLGTNEPDVTSDSDNVPEVSSEHGPVAPVQEKAVWSTAYINDLPDSAFLYIEDGGSKDGEGKTTPRSLRHFPYKDAEGNIDHAHVQNAIAQAPKSNLPAEVQDKVQAKAKKLLATLNAKSFILYKTDEGLRFFTVFSNYFKDKHKEIIKGEAHQEYVDYVTKTGNYPDLWLWHSGPKSKWGKVDWVDYSDGFVVASGLIDEDKYELATNISKEALGVSHGFYGLQSGDVIWRYRSFEISPLPAISAANDFTDINFLFKECEMPFTDAKRAWLKDTAKLPDTVIKEWEDSLAGLNTQLKALGLEWKEAEESDKVDVVAELATLTKAVSLMSTSMAEIVKKQAEVEKDLDTKVAEVFTSQAAKLKDGYKPTEDPKNVTGDVKNKDAADFFGDLILGPLYKR